VTWARLQAGHGRAAVHSYVFTRRPPWSPDSVRKNWGASHFAEFWYMFDHLDPADAAWTDADRGLADAMADAWVAFARDGDPNLSGGPAWPAFTVAEQQVLLLDETITTGDLPNREALAVFDAVYGSIRSPR
jgi:para-nitrobenzyl esterase